MTTLEQDEIDSLLESASCGAGNAGAASHGPPASRESLDLSKISPELRRLLHLQVPIIVQLATRTMPMADVLELTPGSIIEFSRSSDAELDLVVGNRQVGQGLAVKVGENFGLRISTIGPVEDRIRAMAE
ncbi:MAG: FliM/FliN family flagellar motor switch protein [Planctomycetes bacterium]|nr:FliM/FliN family flagellar motor switch protein [Planctomycetota bacterium]